MVWPEFGGGRLIRVADGSWDHRISVHKRFTVHLVAGREQLSQGIRDQVVTSYQKNVGDRGQPLMSTVMVNMPKTIPNLAIKVCNWDEQNGKQERGYGI